MAADIRDEFPVKAEAWTTAQLAAALDAKFCAPEYALLHEVADGTGMNQKRTADAVAMSLWPSRGLSLIGFEAKASRSDWVKELADPSKAESIARFCDYWYLVVGSTAIVKPGELPPTWGLMAPHRGKLCIKEPAIKLAPISISRPFLASLFRRITERIVRDDPIRLAREEGRKAGYEAGKEIARATEGSELNRLRNAHERLQAVIDEFERASGVRLDQWANGAKIGDAVKVVANGGLEAATSRMQSICRDARQILEIGAVFEKAAKEAGR